MLRKVKDYIIDFIKGTDKLLLLLCMITSAFGILAVYSAKLRTITEDAPIPRDVRTMLIAVIVGLVLAIIISLIDYDIICKLWPACAALGIILMILVLIIGVGPPERPDSKVWIDLKVFYFQPSELLKILFVITFSVHLNAVKQSINKIGTLALLAVHAIIPVGLVMISGDDGSALVFILIAIAMIFIVGINWKYILSGVVLALVAIPLMWVKLSNFQKERFIVIFNPDAYPETAYQQNRSIAAISQGGFFGSGLFKGAYTQSGSIPVSESDLIFAVIGEELGMLGALVAMLLIGAIIFRLIIVGRKAVNGTAFLICFGLAAMIAAQSIINIAMCLRVGPVIGITLPFFSAGGSSSLCLYIGMGLAFSIYRSVYNQRPSNFRLSAIRSPFSA